MRSPSPTALSGRKAQAGRNDARILAAAAKVFLADPRAPISRVAAEAGVGISALYHRYRSKEALLRQLCFDGLTRYIAEATIALQLESTVEDLIRTIHAHPTFAEAIGEAAHATHGAAIHS